MNHQDARQIVNHAFVDLFDRVPTLHEAQAIQGIGYLETRYGTAWTGAGRNSKNWGAVQRNRPPCDPSVSFLYTDTHPNNDGTSSTYSICFRKYETDVAGCADLIVVAFGTDVRPKPALDAAARGDLYGVSAAMRKQRFYEGFGKTQSERIANHHKALSSAVRAQCVALGEPFPDSAASFKTQVGKVLGSILPATPFPTLRRGSVSPFVKAWQQALNRLGAGLACDGVFGHETEQMTLKFQKNNALVTDGLVGPKTQAAMRDALNRLPIAA